MLVDKALDDRGHLCQASLLAADGEHLHAIDTLNVLARGLSPKLVGLRRKTLGACEVAIQYSEHGLCVLGNPLLELPLMLFAKYCELIDQTDQVRTLAGFG